MVRKERGTQDNGNRIKDIQRGMEAFVVNVCIIILCYMCCEITQREGMGEHIFFKFMFPVFGHKAVSYGLFLTHQNTLLLCIFINVHALTIYFSVSIKQ